MIRNIAADEPIFYDAGPAGLASLCWFNGVQFAGLLDTSDEDFFGDAVASTHQIQYSRRVQLLTGSIVTVDDVDYKVVGVPRQINDFDNMARLVKLP